MACCKVLLPIGILKGYYDNWSHMIYSAALFMNILYVAEE